MSRTDDIATQVTNRIIAALEEGTVPWAKPWVAGSGPQNVEGRHYQGVNVWLLELEAAAAEYADPRWGTYKMLSAHGGQVRKGEHGVKVIFWSKVPKKKNDPDTDWFWLLKTFTVFNVAQADWATELPPLTSVEGSAEPDEQADEIVASFAPSLRGGLRFAGDRAYYQPSTDGVTCPPREAFTSTGGFYGTVFHELAHATGHETRLDRLSKSGFGTEPYAREELVAEIAAAMLTTHVGLEVEIDNHAAYCGAWLKRLQNDNRLILKASSEAAAAVRMILGTEE